MKVDLFPYTFSINKRQRKPKGQSKLTIHRHWKHWEPKSQDEDPQLQINVRENRRGNPTWTILRHWQNRAYKTQDEDTQHQINVRDRKTSK